MGKLSDFFKRIFSIFNRKKVPLALEAEKPVKTEENRAYKLEEMLEILKKKIEEIRYAIPEKYEEFSLRIKQIEEKMLNFDESKANTIRKI